MDNQNNSEIEISDVEHFRGKDKFHFSHQALVMQAMKRVIEIAGHELHEGINETQIDKYGNRSLVYKENTRLAFLEAVETCLMVMACDLDKDAKDKIKKLSSGLINSWMKHAKAIIVACGDPKKSGTKNGMDYFLVDVAI